MPGVASESRSPRWTLLAICVATFMLLLDITIVNVALPEIDQDLGASFSDLEWVVNAYALGLAAFLLVAGSLGDRLGRRRIFTGGLVLFVAASVLCGLARTPTFLNLARALQGVGGSAMFATSLALIAAAFPVGRERANAIGAWGATIGAAVAVGPLVGGLCVEHLGWESIFFINIPIGAAAVFVTLRYVEESRDPRPRRIDWAGVVVFSAALFALVYALVRGNVEGWGSALIVGCLVASALLFAGFFALELAVAETFDLRLFRNRSFNGVSIAAFGLSAGMFSMFLYLTLYIQNQLEYSPLEAGLRFLPLTLVSFAVAPLTARLAERGPARVFFGIGLGLVGLGLLLMRAITPDSDWTALLPGMLVAGAGVGCTNPIIASVAVGVVEPRDAGMASGINSTFRQVGIATGIAALGAVFQARVESRTPGPAPGEVLANIPLDRIPPPLRDAAHAGFVGALDDILLIGALVAFAAAAAAVALVRR